MRFAATFAALVAVVAAAPQEAVVTKRHGMTVGQAQTTCGSGYEVYCCNQKEEVVPPSPKPGVLGGVLGAVVGPNQVLSHLLGECTKIDVTALIGVTQLLDSECRAHAACCQNNPTTAGGGLINVALACVNVDSLIG